jgi:hypothetical protein
MKEFKDKGEVLCSCVKLSFFAVCSWSEQLNDIGCVRANEYFNRTVTVTRYAACLSMVRRALKAVKWLVYLHGALLRKRIIFFSACNNFEVDERCTNANRKPEYNGQI